MKEIIKFNYEEFGVAKTKAEEIEEAFTPMVIGMNNLQAEYDVFMMLNGDVEALTKDVCKEAGELRKKYVKIRTSTGKAHKETKADFLKAGRYIDSLKNKQAEVSSIAETALTELENYFKNLEKKRLADLQAKRIAEISPYINYDHTDYSGMPDNVWKTFLDGAILAFKNAEEEKAKERAELKAKMEATIEEVTEDVIEDIICETKEPNPLPENSFRKAIIIVREHIRTDSELWGAYKANIAMAFQDAYAQDEEHDAKNKDIHKISNDAAEQFLKNWTS